MSGLTSCCSGRSICCAWRARRSDRDDGADLDERHQRVADRDDAEEDLAPGSQTLLPRCAPGVRRLRACS